MANYKIKKGLNIQLSGLSNLTIEAVAPTQRFAVYPTEFTGVKPRLKVVKGDVVKRGDVLFENKANEKMVFRSPAAGTIQEIRLGERRFPAEIVIESNGSAESVTFPIQTAESISSISREALVDHLLNAGLWPLIKQRPFDKIADPQAEPKAVFVNAMGTAPFQADFSTIVKGEESRFELGLLALTKLTEGSVHLCCEKGSNIPAFENAEQHFFEGKHPAGNTSVHINRISPILPHDTVYTLTAQDVLLLGELLETGEYPKTKVIALGGPAVKEAYRKHYRIPLGADLSALFAEALEEGETRLVAGNVLWGVSVSPKDAVRFYTNEYNALPEDRSRHLLGWTMPGLLQYSVHRVNLSSLPPFKKKKWKLGTNLHGSHRAMVVTGWMDKYQPLNIMTDFLVRACLAHDTDEMIQLGILETHPEDFALAAFLDPHKTDVCGIIQQGLNEIEEEGI